MILIITGIILILAGLVLWLILVNEDTRNKACIFIKKAKKAVYKTVKPICEVFINIKNFFGERFLRRLPFSRPNRKESENAQAGKNF